MPRFTQKFVTHISKRKEVRDAIRNELHLILNKLIEKNDLPYFLEYLDAPGMDDETLYWLVHRRLNPQEVPDEILLKIIRLWDLSTNRGLDTLSLLAYPLSRTKNQEVHDYLSAYAPYLASTNPNFPCYERVFARTLFDLDRYGMHKSDAEFQAIFSDLIKNEKEPANALCLVTARSGLPLHPKTVHAFWSHFKTLHVAIDIRVNNNYITPHLVRQYSAFHEASLKTIQEIVDHFPVLNHLPDRCALYQRPFFRFANLSPDLAMECYCRLVRHTNVADPGMSRVRFEIECELLRRKFATEKRLEEIRTNIRAAVELIK